MGSRYKYSIDISLLISLIIFFINLHRTAASHWRGSSGVHRHGMDYLTYLGSRLEAEFHRENAWENPWDGGKMLGKMVGKLCI